MAGKSNASRALGGDAGATQGVPGDPRQLSDRNCCTVTSGGASAPEVLAPAKLEGIFAVVITTISYCS